MGKLSQDSPKSYCVESCAGRVSTCSLSLVDPLGTQCYVMLCNRGNKSCQDGTEHTAKSAESGRAENVNKTDIIVICDQCHLFIFLPSANYSFHYDCCFQ